MLCLHGKPCRGNFSRSGFSWQCAEPSTCHFKCSEEETSMYDQAVKRFLEAKQPRPKCCVKIAGSYRRGKTPEVPRRYAKMKPNTDVENYSFARPYFVCSKKRNPCSYFAWGDGIILEKPLCDHGKPSKRTWVKKEGPNKGRMFYCCAEQKENMCKFSQWTDDPSSGPMIEKS